MSPGWRGIGVKETVSLYNPVGKIHEQINNHSSVWSVWIRWAWVMWGNALDSAPTIHCRARKYSQNCQVSFPSKARNPYFWTYYSFCNVSASFLNMILAKLNDFEGWVQPVGHQLMNSTSLSRAMQCHTHLWNRRGLLCRRKHSSSGKDVILCVTVWDATL